MAKTLFDKVWDAHVVKKLEGGVDVLYIDRHLIHEVTSPQAFAELEKRELSLFRKEQMVATPDHNVPTLNQHLPIREALSKHQVDTLLTNCHKFGVELFALGHPFQGIVHVIGPELGITLPGGAGDGCTVPAADPTQNDANHHQRAFETRRAGQRHHSLHHFQTYCGRRYRLLRGVCRFGH